MINLEALTITLEQELSIYNVSTIKEQILKDLSSDNVVLDCSKLEYIDSAGIQLLLSLDKSLLNQELGLKIVNLSSKIKEDLELLDISEIVDID